MVVGDYAAGKSPAEAARSNFDPADKPDRFDDGRLGLAQGMEDHSEALAGVGYIRGLRHGFSRAGDRANEAHVRSDSSSGN